MPELEKVKCSTPDFAAENAKKLLALFPECEGQKGEIDIDKLRQVLSSSAIEGNVERYQFTWPGKRAAMAAASAATTKTLRPCREDSVGRDGTSSGFDSENLYIEGDNLEVLKLLQTSYANQVKMIYIDPPYNTGHDFVYRDRFSLTQKELDDEAGAFDEDGNRFEVNDSAEARYHSNWCSMMYPRLKLARNLLRDDGVIFISIDDNEVTNTRKLCDEVFGEEQFVAQIAWRRTDNQANIGGFAKVKEYVVIYAKSYMTVLGRLPLSDKAKGEYRYSDARGLFRRAILLDKTRGRRFYPKMTKLGNTLNGPWMVPEEEFDRMDAAGEIYWTENGDGQPYGKIYLADSKGQIPNDFWGIDFGTNQRGSLEVEALFERRIFDFPKPVSLVENIVRLGSSEKDSYVLDFFSGSATTAHAVMQLNAEDGGNRKFIMVQLPEKCDEDSEAVKAGYKTICEIGKERIRRAGKKIAEENATIAPNLDIGFRVLKLDTSSLRDTSATVSETNQEFSNFERVRSDRSAEDLLFQMLLETRLPLSESISKAEIAGNEVFFVGGNGAGAPLVACLDAQAKMTTDFFLEIAKLKPGIAFFRDDAFADDSARTNVQQAFDQFSPTTSIKVI